jgi:hypothetical protein
MNIDNSVLTFHEDLWEMEDEGEAEDLEEYY